MAALAGVRNSFENPLKCLRTNIEGTANIAENIRKSNIKKLIFASSSSVYGNCKSGKFSEDLQSLSPISPYAVSKLTCEQLLHTYSLNFNIQTLCLRFFTVYGPRQRPDLAIRKFSEFIIKGKPIPVYGDGTTVRDYTYIDDIIDGICSAIKYDKSPYEIINLGSVSPVSLNKMIEILEKTLCKKAIINYLPMQKGDVLKTVSDINKAKELLNFSPQTSFESGIKKFIEWLNS